MRAEKQFLVDEVAGHLAKSSYLLVANFTKVTVKDATDIRNQLRPLGAEYHVVKNSILAIAATQLIGIGIVVDDLVNVPP